MTLPTQDVAALEARLEAVEGVLRALLTTVHIGDKIPYATYRQWHDAISETKTWGSYWEAPR